MSNTHRTKGEYKKLYANQNCNGDLEKAAEHKLLKEVVETLVNDEEENEGNTKVKVKSAEIVVHGTADKPYYEIKYYDVADGKYHIGYSSYNLKYVFQWLEECFEIVE